jgi:hypothetical protein
MSAINDIVAKHQEIEQVWKSKAAAYAIDWTANICTEIKIDQKRLWTERVKESVLEILRPVTDIFCNHCHWS